MTNIKPSQQLPSLSLLKISYDRKQIRARLLKRDGLARPIRKRRPLPLCRRKAETANTSVVSSTSSHTTKLNPRKVRGIITPLHCNISVEPIKCGKSNKETRQRQRRWKKSSIVQFHKEVSVIQIKSRRDYSKCALKRMYSTRKEIKDNARRNKIEFYAEGKDWRNALEEDEMLMDEDGELFHPVHSVGLDSFVKDGKCR